MINVETSEVMELMETPRQLKRGLEAVKGINDYLATHKPIFTVSWEVAEIIKGGNFGLYYKMRREGSQSIANHILLEEGLSQKLSLKQEMKLKTFDMEYKL